MSSERQAATGPWWDCHFHVFDNARYPLAPGAAYIPKDAALDAFRQVCESRGIQRAVLVHPSVYGADHASFEDALAAHGDWLRGVAVVYPDVAVTSDAQIARWHRLGACGTRINRLFPGAPDGIASIIDRVKPFGWHVQVLVDLAEDLGVVKQIAASGMQVVIDHFGHHPADELLRSAAFADLLSLMREGQAWVKLSGPYRVQRTQGPWSSLRPLIDAMVAANARRLVWGSDWPHPPNAKHPFPPPEPSEIRSTIAHWLDGPELLERVMHENPSALYDRSWL
jgi:predicted TIM-barrel fold metal-dependent hydrolase